MKFLKIHHNKINFKSFNFNIDSDISSLNGFDVDYLFYIFDKKKVRNRKNFYKTRPGISKNFNKNSIFRDENLTLIQKFISLNTKKGKKPTVLKNINNVVQNLNFILIYYSKEFETYKDYSIFYDFYNQNTAYMSFHNIFNSLTENLESIFEIKTKKNNKKLKSENKYSHEISYIPKVKRIKYILRALSFYKESFKNYSFWERLFWSIFTILVNKNKSFLKKRRDYIYLKSLKFFNKKKNPLK